MRAHGTRRPCYPPDAALDPIRFSPVRVGPMGRGSELGASPRPVERSTRREQRSHVRAGRARGRRPRAARPATRTTSGTPRDPGGRRASCAAPSTRSAWWPARCSSGGHVLVEDLPGTGKTTLAKAFARAVGGSFARVQGTPDLMPADVTGSGVWDDALGRAAVRARPGVRERAAGRRAQPRRRRAPSRRSWRRSTRVRSPSDGVRHPAARPVLRHRHPEPVRPARHVRAARGRARPVRRRGSARATLDLHTEMTVVREQLAGPTVDALAPVVTSPSCGRRGPPSGPCTSPTPRSRTPSTSSGPPGPTSGSPRAPARGRALALVRTAQAVAPCWPAGTSSRPTTPRPSPSPSSRTGSSCTDAGHARPGTRPSWWSPRCCPGRPSR